MADHTDNRRWKHHAAFVSVTVFAVWLGMWLIGCLVAYAHEGEFVYVVRIGAGTLALAIATATIPALAAAEGDEAVAAWNTRAESPAKEPTVVLPASLASESRTAVSTAPQGVSETEALRAALAKATEALEDILLQLESRTPSKSALAQIAIHALAAIREVDPISRKLPGEPLEENGVHDPKVGS